MIKKEGPFNIKKLAESRAKRLRKKGYNVEIKRRRGRYPSYVLLIDEKKEVKKMVKIIAGSGKKLSKINIGDILVTPKGKILTGKGKSICLNGKFAKYSKNIVNIKTENPFSGEKKEINLSKKEIKLLLKNFQDAR